MKETCYLLNGIWTSPIDKNCAVLCIKGVKILIMLKLITEYLFKHKI